MIPLGPIVPDRGPTDARLVIIGDAPFTKDSEQQVAFAGPQGYLLESWLIRYGINKGQVYYTYVVGQQPPANKFAALPRELVALGATGLHSRLAALRGPVVIVPTGNRALRALFQQDPLDDRGGMKISDYRGSILAYTDSGGRTVKVIPTIHPAATFRRPVLTKFCLADWQRIAGDLDFPDLRIPQREHRIANQQSMDRFLAELDHQPALAVDLECEYRGKHRLQCIAFSYDPAWSLTIPFVDDPGGDYSKACRWYAKQICEHPVAKVLQNGLFDQFILARDRIGLTNFAWDTLEMHHALDPNDGSDPQSEELDTGEDIRISLHSLAVLASLYTRVPYYKGDAKEGWRTGNFAPDALWNYCGDDAIVTLMVFNALKPLLKERGLL